MAALMVSLAQRERLREIRIPTLVIHGDDDPLVHLKHGVDTASMIPGAKLLMIQGMGHELPPAVWAQVVEAITKHAV